MKIIFKGELLASPANLMRRCGYHIFKDPRTGESGYFRRLGNGHYPRFHVHLKELAQGGMEVDLHLDMKQRSLGNKRHGIGNDELVSAERQRIKEYILSLV